MCRLYGFLSNEPTKVDCSLVFAQNALLLQSRSDEIGLDHADGWGIGSYTNGQPRIIKSAVAAFNDQSFSTTAEKLYSNAIVAHIRKATVGVTDIHNTHPFSVGKFIFAHNGTVVGFKELRNRLEQETDRQLQTLRVGSTDSEQYFLWLMTRLNTAGMIENCDAGFGNVELSLLETSLLDSVKLLAERCDSLKSDKTTRLNFVLTDGTTLAACRWNHSLHIIHRNGLYECEICGIPHIHHHQSVNYQAVTVASEPITGDVWTEFPNYSVRCFRLDQGTNPGEAEQAAGHVPHTDTAP